MSRYPHQSQSRSTPQARRQGARLSAVAGATRTLRTMATIPAARPLTVDLCLQIAVCLYVYVYVYVYADSHVEVPGKYNVQVDYDDDDDSGSDFDEVSQRAAKSKWRVEFFFVFLFAHVHTVACAPWGCIVRAGNQTHSKFRHPLIVE